jgi:hypothetical protein
MGSERTREQLDEALEKSDCGMLLKVKLTTTIPQQHFPLWKVHVRNMPVALLSASAGIRGSVSNLP